MSTLLMGVAAVAAGGTGALPSGSVTSEVYLSNFTGTTIFFGAAEVSYGPSGSSVISSFAPDLLSPITVSVDVADVGVDLRAVTVTWQASAPTGFFNGPLAIAGEPLGLVSFAFGMEDQPNFPSPPLNAFDDPDAISVVSTRGELRDVNGALLMEPEFFAVVFDEGGIGGRRVLSMDRDDISVLGWASYSATIVYSVPGPASAGVLGLGAWACWRRRR